MLTGAKRFLDINSYISNANLFHSFLHFRRSEFATTDTLDSAIAAPAKMGESVHPVSG